MKERCGLVGAGRKDCGRTSPRAAAAAVIRAAAAAAALSALVLCTSCGTAPGNGADEAERTPEPGVYQIYTVDLGGAPGDSYDYADDEQDPQVLAQALIEQLAAEPEETGRGPAIPDGVAVPEVTVTGSAVSVDYADDYAALSSVEEILSRAAVVRTLGQIPGVNYVTFSVGGEPLIDASGEAVGYMQPSDFISNLSSLDEVGTAELTLWFLDAETGELVPVNREVTFASHTTRETAAVRALIAGPDDEAYLPTLPPTTSLINVQVRDRVCYVNLGRGFLDAALDLDVSVPIDSLVLTLLETDDVDMVQILVDGSTAVMFRDLIPLSTVFTGTVEEMGLLSAAVVPETGE